MAYSPKPVVPPMAVIVTVLGGVAFAGLALWAYHVKHAAVVGTIQHGAAYLRELPWPVFYLAVALLPFAFFPVSLLYLSAGAVHGLVPSLLGIVAATAVNISLSYWLAAGPLHGLIRRWFARRGREIPVLPAEEHIWAVLVVRFTPAFPLMVQNYLLGLAHIPFWKYFWISLAAEAVIAFGYILAGEAITQKRPGFVLLAFGCIVGAVLLTRVLRRTFARRVHPLVTGEGAAQTGAEVADKRKGEPAKGSPEKR